ncbi:MAG: DNA polymerase IV, partial [Deltaproteobacteria bacterium]
MTKGEEKVEGTAKAIKERIREVFGLPCTVGVGPNKLVAKIAGSMAKPDGLKIVPPEEVARMMEALPVGELWCVGENIAASLEAMGIRSCGQLSKLPPSLLRRRFGIRGEALRKMAQGVDETPVVPFWEARPSKSMGHSLTLDEDISDKGRLRRYLLLLSEQV